MTLLGDVTRTGYRLNELRSEARGSDKEKIAEEVANLLDEAYDAVFNAQLILENEKESE